MKKSGNTRPKFLKHFGKSCIIGIPIMVIIVIALMVLMFNIDKAAMKNRVFSEYNSLYQIDRIYDGADYTKNDLFYKRMKEAFLDCVERNNDINLYATVANHDGIVKVSSKKAVRMYVLKIDADLGADYFCEEESFLEWYQHGIDSYYYYLEEAKGDNKTILLNVTVNDAYLQNNGLFIPGAAHIEIVSMSRGAGKGAVKNEVLYSDLYEYAGEVSYGAEYVIEQYGYEDCDVSMEDRYRLILEDLIKGTEEESGIFNYVDGKGNTKYIKKELGDVELNLTAELVHGSDSLNVYARANVIKQNFARYIVATLASLLVGVLIMIGVATITYHQQCSTYEREQFRINLMNSMAHDLKTPLAAMNGYAENLLDNIRTDKQEHYAKSIKDNAEYMNELIKNVLLLSKSEDKRIKLDKKTIDLIAISNTLWEKYKLMAEDNDITVQISGECIIDADEKLMSSVLDNLLANALTYAKKNSVIEVKGTGKVFTIANHTDETFENGTEILWTPFEKGNSARSERNGSGLGLSIVRNVCLLHGFKSTIKNENDVFTVVVSC